MQIAFPLALTLRRATRLILLAVTACVLLPLGVGAAEPPRPLRALLIAGGCCHDYAKQKDLLKNGLEARALVSVDVIYSEDRSTRARFEIYEDPNWAAGYDVILHDECSADVKEMEYVRNILNAHKTVPAVNLHCAMHSYRIESDEWFRFVGIHSTSHGPQEPIRIQYVDRQHPITRALSDWTTIREELYNNVKVFETATPLARGRQTVRNNDGTLREVEAVVAWGNQYGSTRVFSTTLGHNNETVGDPRYLDLVTRGMLWATDRLNETYLKAQAPTVRRVNIAQGKPATASSEETGKENFASRAVDGNSSTRWCASGPSDREWLQVDLGEPMRVTGVRVSWESDDAVYFHQIEGSADGTHWKLLVDAARNAERGVSAHDFLAEDIRFVRLNYLGKAGGGWGSVWEFEIFSDRTEVVSADQARDEADRKHLSDVKAPDDFDVTIFAAPPLANYPVFVAASTDGTVFVSSDGNGSIGRDPHRGRILRLRDLDGDGRADEVKEFVKDVDSPRGLVWDHDRLYLLHPPHISVFIDTNGDGEADEQKILVRDIAFTFKDRPADHSSNGLSLGIDGWFYAAIGDFGFMEAEGTDGRKLQLRGGGIVRVRPDGTGLQLYARGTRNVMEAATSPLLDLFQRDNTNDGDGWDVRFHHSTALGEHGYPSLYKHFDDEIIQPIADYGGGSGCGAAWISEPGIPERWNHGAFTADWGRNWVYRHGITPNGATYTVDQKEFFGATRVTDLDVDGMSAIYVASWKGATFNWAGPDVGYVVRLTPKGYRAEPLPDFAKASEAELVKLLQSPSHRRRLEAQRTLVRRGLSATAVEQILTVARARATPLESRVAALYTLALGLGEHATPWLVQLSADRSIEEFAVRALADRADLGTAVPLEPILRALESEHPRTRLQAAFALARLDRRDASGSLTRLLADPDPIVVHTAVAALRQLRAAGAVFAVVDQTGAPPAQRAAALRVLQSLHDPAVVSGLMTRLDQERSVERRRGLITALCRLHFREGVWKGDSWATRPDTSGPYYQTEAWEETPDIGAFLKARFARAEGAEAAHLLSEFNRHKIPTDEILNTALQLAEQDPSLLNAALGQLSRSEQIPGAAVPLLLRALAAEETGDIPRAQAALALTKSGSGDAVPALVEALARLEKARDGTSDRERRQARQAILNAALMENHVAVVAERAGAGKDSSVYADAILLKVSDRPSAGVAARAQARAAIDAGWNDPARRVQILRAIQMVEHRPARDKVVAALDDTDPAVREAATKAAGTLRLDLAQEKAAAVKVGSMPASDALAAVEKQKGDVKLGEQLYVTFSCANCHTTSPDEPQRGPYLGNIAATYNRRELAESILLPDKSIAQGFTTHSFELTDGSEWEGFVTREAADKVTFRTVSAHEVTVLVEEILKREKLEKSLMPPGMADELTLREFASLIDYLESLNKQ